jgi:hypothetical protein
MLDVAHWPPWMTVVGGSIRATLRWAAAHTGLPVVIVTAIALVASWHLFKRSLGFAIEVALTATLLLVLAKLGLLSW